jgi:hypothetical protein
MLKCSATILATLTIEQCRVVLIERQHVPRCDVARLATRGSSHPFPHVL